MTRAEVIGQEELNARRTGVTALSGLSAFMLAYLFASVTRPVTVLYEPLRRVFFIARSAPAPAMSYYGLLFYGFAFGVLVSAGVWRAVKGRAPSGRLVHGLSLVAFVLIGAAVAWDVHQFAAAP